MKQSRAAQEEEREGQKTEQFVVKSSVAEAARQRGAPAQNCSQAGRASSVCLRHHTGI